MYASAEQSFVLLDYLLSTTRCSVNGSFMSALALPLTLIQAVLSDQLKWKLVQFGNGVRLAL